MMRLSALKYYAVLTLLVCFVGGCVPSGDEHIDEKNDPNYQRGRALVGSQDFKGAIEEFEKALEVNPRSSAAHFEMAWLCEEKTKDYAAAIYHYQKHLELQPNSEYADKARDHIQVCKRELAKAEFAPPSTQHLQREIDRLNAENLILRQQADMYRTQLVAAISAAQARPAPADPPKPATDDIVPGPDPIPRPAGAQRLFSNSIPITTIPSNVTRPRTHVVKPGETVASIALQYGLKPRAVLSANPKVDPRRLKVGQSLVLP